MLPLTRLVLALALILAGSVSAYAQITVYPSRTNVFGTQTITVPNIVTTSTSGITTTNPTASTAGVPVQYSPAWTTCGTAYNSTSALSEVHCWRYEVRPVTVAGTTTSSFWLARSINGGAYVDEFQFTSAGSLILPNSSTQSVGVVLNTGSAISAPGGVPLFSTATPTVASGFGTSPSVSGGKAHAMRVNVGTGGTASAGIITVGATAAVGWNCSVKNLTALAANRANQWTVQTASTTTTVSVQNQTISTGAALAWTASDILAVSCIGF